jgi:hypothetical protein
MDLTWNEILIKVAQLVVYGLVGVLIPLGFSLLKNKIKNDTAIKIIENIEKSILDVIETINEEFVDSLKEQGKFDEEAQRIAFEEAKARILDMLNDNAKEAIMMLYGDLEAWLESKITNGVTEVKLRKAAVGLYPTSRQLSCQ